MTTYFRLSAVSVSEVSYFLNAFSYVSSVEYNGDAAEIEIHDLALNRVILVETSADIAEIFDN